MTTNQQAPMGKKQLIRSLLIAMGIGLLVLVTAILPAEYNVDPLGTGKLFGFSRLYVDEAPIPDQTLAPIPSLEKKKLKLEKLGSSPDVPKPVEADNPPPAEQFSEQDDTVQVVVPAGKGIEYKFRALKYAAIKYEWSTADDKIVYIDFHGEVQQENPPENVFYESYTLAYSNNMVGTFTAPFEGRHGWYFRNEHATDVTVTIRLRGQYQLFDQ